MSNKLLSFIAKKYSLDLAKEYNEMENVDELSISHFIRQCCILMGVDEKKIKSPERKRPIVVPRQAIMWALDDLNWYSQTEIGSEFNRNRTMVIHSRETINDLLYQKDRFAQECTGKVLEELDRFKNKHHEAKSNNEARTSTGCSESN